MASTNHRDAASVLSELKGSIDSRPGKRADFAREVGIGEVYLSQILNGRRPLDRLPLGTVLKIFEAAKVPTERLADIHRTEEVAQ